jgi:hypothetical protein
MQKFSDNAQYELRVTSQRVTGDDDMECIFYGVTVLEGGKPTLIFSDLTADKDLLLRFLLQIEQGDVERIHLPGILEDFAYEQYLPGRGRFW